MKQNISLDRMPDKIIIDSESLENQKDVLAKLEYAKDSPTRSFLKALSWRVIASSTTFLVTFIIFRNTTDKTLDEVLETAWYVTVVEFSAKILIYYLHERLWTNIRWGKYWKRHYWTRRGWKKLYRKMHKNQSN